MKRLVLAFAVAVLTAAPLVRGEAALDEARLTLRHEMLRLINADRVRNGLAKVELDPEASAIADAYCREQIRNRTTGHFTTDGEAPYMRYSFAGGNDGLSENAAAWSASYNLSDRAVFDLARRSQQAMMSEVEPHDGHRRTILDPWATHVGIGLEWEKGEFRMAQEFLRRYVAWSRPFPRAAALEEPVSGTGRPAPGFKVQAITVHHEAIPDPMPAHVASAISVYRLPVRRREFLPRLRNSISMRQDGTLRFMSERYADGRRGDFYVSPDGAFTFPVPFLDGPGIYTVVVWVSEKDADAPLAASNISIRVDRPAESYAGTR